MATTMNPDTANPPAPLAPSVEKAYYRKCIALKRRLNEVEASNDDAKLRRLRLDRSIMKMRLERAFLLDELRRRMDNNIDGSEGSGEEGMATPPPDRPHRDKRRRPTSGGGAGNNNAAQSSQGNFQQQAQYTPSQSRNPSDPQLVPGPRNAMVPPNMVPGDGRYFYSEQQQQQGQSVPPPPPPAGPMQHGSPPYGAPTRNGRTNSMEMGATSEDVNGRGVVASSVENGAPGEGAFTAVNQ